MAFSQTCFRVESGFLSFLDVFMGAEHNERFESSSNHHFRDTPQHFHKTYFCIDSWLHTKRFSGVLNTMVLKALAFTVSKIPHSIFWKLHFYLESGFLSLLELESCLLVSFQGCWTQWQRFEKSNTHHFRWYLIAFSQNTILLRKWLSFIPRAPEMDASKFSGVQNKMAKVWNL